MPTTYPDHIYPTQSENPQIETPFVNNETIEKAKNLENRVIIATVYETMPQIPILLYHRFLPDQGGESTSTKMRLSDLQMQLEKLYIAGFSLISIDDFMDGNLIVPDGRKPLIITIDDAYFADQLFLDEDGMPSNNTGVGVMKAFSSENPDFQFAIAMFANLGDKHYGNLYKDGWWYETEGWQEDLARVIAWGINNNVMPYNHMYTHPRLDLCSDDEITHQAETNDLILRELLGRIKSAELIESINNYIALPFGIWPATITGTERLLAYINPEGKPLRAIFEASYASGSEFAEPPFSSNFDSFHIPRIAVSGDTIDGIVSLAEDLPKAKKCILTILVDPDQQFIMQLEDAIWKEISDGQCKNGIYITEQGIFKAEFGDVTQVIIED